MHERFERRTSFTIGFPAPEILGAESKFTDGSMSALSGPGGEASFQVAVPLQPGNTGGPLVDNAGHGRDRDLACRSCSVPRRHWYASTKRELGDQG